MPSINNITKYRPTIAFEIFILTKFKKALHNSSTKCLGFSFVSTSTRRGSKERAAQFFTLTRTRTARRATTCPGTMGPEKKAGPTWASSMTSAVSFSHHVVLYRLCVYLHSASFVKVYKLPIQIKFLLLIRSLFKVCNIVC